MSIESLRAIPFFANLHDNVLGQILRVQQELTIQPGQILMRQDDPGDRFYIILDGEVEIIKGLGTSDETLMNVRGPGDILGEMSFFMEEKRATASVRAITPTRLVMLTHANFDTLLSTSPTMAYGIIRVLSQRLNESNEATIRDLRQKNLQLTQAYADLQAAQAQLVQKEALERELQIAKQIQLSILPDKLPDAVGYEFGAHMLPARFVGGDLYDFIPLDKEKIGVVIGDVSDKGVPAAIFMALVRSLVRAEAMRMTFPATALRRVNQHLLAMNSMGLFVTLIYGVLNLARGEFTYARAGHELPLLFKGDGAEVALPVGQGQLLGVFPEITLDEQTIAIPTDGLLFLYTDGAIDALNPQGERYQGERLRKTVCKSVGIQARQACDRILADIQAYQADALQADDITFVVISRQEK
jgi:sigma-B regulation protein RsbU (phosphoserine phosphatase)